MKTIKILIQSLIISICASIAIASCSIGAVTEGIGDGTKDYVTVSFDSLGGNSVVSIGLQEFRGCSNLSIYCEAPSKPAGWADSWNQDNRPVFWNQTSAP